MPPEIVKVWLCYLRSKYFWKKSSLVSICQDSGTFPGCVKIVLIKDKTYKENINATKIYSFDIEICAWYKSNVWEKICCLGIWNFKKVKNVPTNAEPRITNGAYA